MNDVIEHQGGAVAVGGARGAMEIRAQVQLIQEVLKEVMLPGVHYGYIPGTEPKNEEEKKFKKPSLLKAGAEKLCMVFRLGPDYEIYDKERSGDHLLITSKCILTHIPTGQRVGSALASCSTMESKYAYRKGQRKCPECGAEAIIKGKAEYGGGWLCFKAKNGCGAKFPDGDDSIESQQSGKVDNEDKADQYNTVLKMSNKRALLAAVLNATAASDIFSQDLMDDIEGRPPEATAAGRDAASSDTKRQPVKQPTAKSARSDPAASMEGVDPERKINAAQQKMIQTSLDNAGVSAQALCEHFKIEGVPSMPFKDVNLALKWIVDNKSEQTN